MPQFIKMNTSDRLWLSLTVPEMLNHTQAFQREDTGLSVGNYAATFTSGLVEDADPKKP